MSLHFHLKINIWLILFYLLYNNVIFTASSTETWQSLETKYFHIRLESTPYLQAVSLREWGMMLEQLPEQWDAKLAPLFGGQKISDCSFSSVRKPTLSICANRQSYLTLAAKYGLTSQNTAVWSSGGFYHRESNIILAYRQPTDYYTRHVVLHEASHWYCDQLLATRYEKLPHWLCEGLADFCAFHVWNGKILHAMHMPRVSLENYPSRLVEILKARQKAETANPNDISPTTIAEQFEQLQLRNIGNASAVPHDLYALAWGATAFLIERFPDETRRFFLNLKQYNVAESWQAAFSSSKIEWDAQFFEWANAQQLEWEWIWNLWEDDGESLLAVSDTTALIVQNTTSSQLHFEASPLLDGTTIGVVFYHGNNQTFEMLQFHNVGTPDAEWRRVEFTDDKWKTLTHWQLLNQEKTRNVSKNSSLEIDIQSQPTTNGELCYRIFADKILIFEFNNKINTVLRLGIAVQTGAASQTFLQ
ncbi:MAG: hypothetical protein LBJ67_13900 [Planctomycetaceae bacterium]|jgi:hypothetical protein|nr:hypothetical protein [Planctomycetaceae bacterium]